MRSTASERGQQALRRCALPNPGHAEAAGGTAAFTMRGSELGGLLYVGVGQLPLHTDDAATVLRRLVRGCSVLEHELRGQLLDVHSERIAGEDAQHEGVGWRFLVRFPVAGAGGPPRRGVTSR